MKTCDIFHLVLVLLFICALIVISVILTTTDILSVGGIRKGYHHVPVPPALLLKHLSTKGPYNDRELGDNREEEREGCKPLKLWYFGRHGSRNPGLEKTQQMLEELEGLKGRILNASEFKEGNLGLSEIQNLKKWRLPSHVTPDTESYLVTRGVKELRGIGSRFRKRYPKLFSKITPGTIRFRTTSTQRTIASAAAFIQGALNMDQVPPYLLEEPLNLDQTIKFYESCTKWHEEVEINPEANLETLRFGNSEVMNRTILRISERLGFDNDTTLTLTLDQLILIYRICAYETAWEDGKPSAWCGVFDEEDLQVMAYREDLGYYWINGYGYNINYEQACKPFEDLLEFLSPNNTLKVRGYFSHSRATLKMLARLGLFKDQTPLRSDNYEEVKSTYKWRTSFMDTMATNMAFVLYSCTVPGNDSSLQLGFLFQEKPLALSACGNAWMCPLQTFLDGYSSSLDGQCNFNATCGL